MSHLWTMAHPNGKGTGCAITLELNPAHGCVDGYIALRMARQTSVAPRGHEDLFDWSRAVKIKLGIDDIAHMLEVLRGAADSIDDGKGLFHRTATMNATLRLERRLEPVCGYLLEVKRRLTDTPDASMEQWDFLFRPREAHMLMLAMEHSVPMLAFGWPSAC